MRVVDLLHNFEALHVPMAHVLVVAFKDHWPEAWPTLESALEEVREFNNPERVCRVALDDANEVLGWVGSLPQYDGNVWELHPLAVHPAHQRRGVGRVLVADLEDRVRERGGLTIMLGTDDDADMTTLSGADLYADLWERVRTIRNLRGHPYEFYRKMGYTITGVVPDANGRGKPDILMAKRIE
jgi:aminoglycoside 6'-N-acetyltransferase I